MSDWPDFMHRLLPGLSASSHKAVLPPGARLVRRSAEQGTTATGWSGLWKGRGGIGYGVDAMLAVRDTPEGTFTVDWAAADNRPTSEVASAPARLVDRELVAALPEGSSLRLWQRDDDTLEFLHEDREGAGICGALARWSDDIVCRRERIPTPLRECGEAVTLVALVYRPPGDGPFPTLLFNHGSTGQENDPSLTLPPWTSLSLARHFVERGWMVVFPQRRGRSGSGGTCAESTFPHAASYLMDPAPVHEGIDRALADIDAATTWLQARDDVRSARTVIAGHSRGGALSIAYAGTHSHPFRAVINFSGGWFGHKVPNALAVNTALAERGAGFNGPTLWLYARRDPFYPIDHTRACFDAFVAAGGVGTFRTIRAPTGMAGHQLVHALPRWTDTVDDFLTLGR